jgi:hypothetical protein
MRGALSVLARDGLVLRLGMRDAQRHWRRGL